MFSFPWHFISLPERLPSLVERQIILRRCFEFAHPKGTSGLLSEQEHSLEEKEVEEKFAMGGVTHTLEGKTQFHKNLISWRNGVKIAT